MPKLNVKRVIIFKHGVSYFILKGTLKGNGIFELEFKIDEMNDVLKSLFVMDTSEKGYISSISYDAALDTYQLLKSIMLDIPDVNSFSSLVTQIKGANATLTVGSSETINGTIMGIESIQKTQDNEIVTEKLLIFLRENNVIAKIPFSEITSFEILNEDLKKDLQFFLDTVIAGKKKDSKKIIIHCESGGDEGEERKIVVSYIRESPIWKTSYRLIMTKTQEKDNKCLLSGWALIENTTNQDWEDIELTLTAGLPVSFIYDFYRPIFIDRPKIEPPKVLSARPTEIEDGLEMDKFADYEVEEEPVYEKKKMAKQAPRAPPPAKPAASGGELGALRDTMLDEITRLKGVMGKQAQVKTKDLGELFEYQIANPVSIKRKQSALVPILTEEIEAKKLLLYNLKEMDKNPNACLEITNNSSLTLERGPVTIIYDNNLAGEAMIPFLNRDDTRLLNYAVEQAVMITHEEKHENKDIHRISLGGGYCYEYFYTDHFTTYKIKNKTKEAKKLYLDHPKTSGYEITNSPVKPEETPNYWRFKLDLKPNDAIKFKISERSESYTNYYIYNYSKENLLKRVSFYVQKKFIDMELEVKLSQIGELIGKRNSLKTTRDRLQDAKYEMEQDQSRLRENIRVLGNTTQENSLREKYVKKLADQENNFENMLAEIKKLDQQIEELDKEIDKKIEKLELD